MLYNSPDFISDCHVVLRWRENKAFVDWKIKNNLKEILDSSGGLGYQETWLEYLLL